MKVKRDEHERICSTPGPSVPGAKARTSASQVYTTRFRRSDRPTPDQEEYLAGVQQKIGDYDPDVFVGGVARKRVR